MISVTSVWSWNHPVPSVLYRWGGRGIAREIVAVAADRDESHDTGIAYIHEVALTDPVVWTKTPSEVSRHRPGGNGVPADVGRRHNGEPGIIPASVCLTRGTASVPAV
jgi:hypothetical protein